MMYGNNFTQMFAEFNGQYDSDMYMTSLSYPLQVEGTVNGVPVYFRARDGDWRFVIHPTDPSLAMESTANFYCEGEYKEGNLTADNLHNILRVCVMRYYQSIG